MNGGRDKFQGCGRIGDGVWAWRCRAERSGALDDAQCVRGGGIAGVHDRVLLMTGRSLKDGDQISGFMIWVAQR